MSDVAVINHDPCMQRLAWTEPSGRTPSAGPDGKPRFQPRTGKSVAILPGLNFVDGEVIDKTRPEDLDVDVDPTKMAIRQAVELAGKTTSKSALKIWLECEEREPVRAAIEQALGH